MIRGCRPPPSGDRAKPRAAVAAARPPAVAPPVRVAAIALRTGLGEQRAKAVARAIERCFEDCSTSQLALLPGVNDDAADGADWGRAVTACADRHGVAILYERKGPRGPRFCAYDPPVRGEVLSIEQLFATSAKANESPELVDALVNRCAPGGGGSAFLAGRMVGLLVCGENNVLCNAQSNRNAVSVRHHAGVSLFEHAQIICNGSHTLMGNWGKLDRRFEYLSRSGRCAVYATNCHLRSWRRACRAYINGHRVATGEGAESSVASARVIRDSADAFRAIVLDLPVYGAI